MPTWLKGVLVLLFSVFLSGCFSTGDHESRGVKLSDAMDSSAKGDHRDLGGSSSGGGRSGDVDADVDVHGSTDGESMMAASFDEKEYHWEILADVSYSTPFNNDIESITHFTLTPVCLEDEKNFLGIYLGGATVEFKSGSLPDRATKDPWMFELGLTYRRYLNSSRTAFSPYIGGNLGYELLVWSYRNPIISGGDTIRRDVLSGGKGSIVFGVSTRRDKRLSVFGEVGLGGTFFLDQTGEGFENDVFDGYGFFTVKAGLSFKF